MYLATTAEAALISMCSDWLGGYSFTAKVKTIGLTLANQGPQGV